MSGVWDLKGPVIHEIPLPSNARRKVLVHLPTDEEITSYASLDSKLTALGWERYYDKPDLIQYHKRSSLDLISLPRDFNNLQPQDLYNIVVQSHGVFKVR